MRVGGHGRVGVVGDGAHTTASQQEVLVSELLAEGVEHSDGAAHCEQVERHAELGAVQSGQVLLLHLLQLSGRQRRGRRFG